MSRIGPLAITWAVLATACAAASPVAGPSSPTATESRPAQPSPTPVTTTPSPVTPTPSVTPPVIEDFAAGDALAFATHLASLGTRDAGTDGDVAARAVIRDAFAMAGWLVVEQEVALPQGGSSTNLVAVRTKGDLDGPHVVIGGHHDTRGGSPGANDNASGIGVLVSLARELADEPLAVPVALVAFAAEEFQPSQPREHHLGSTAYVARHGDNVRAALIVDMIANGPSTCLCWLRQHARTVVERLERVIVDEGLSGYDAQARGDISDHGPFATAGIPSALLWTFDDGVLHTPADTADRLRVEDLRRAGDLALAFARSLRHSDLSPW